MRITRSFRFAWDGIRYCTKTQPNFRIHLVILSLIMALGFLFNINKSEWIAIVFCGMMVLILEMINTALEYLCNTVTTEFHPAIKAIKDISAGAVLVSAAGSVLIGAIIFIPKIVSLLS
jgi:diacylglycerol kinase (ATP)